MTCRLLLLTILLNISCSLSDKKESNTRSIPPTKGRSDSTVTIPLKNQNKESFKTLQLLAGKIELAVPEQLQLMNKRMFELKYPFEDRSMTIAYSDQEATVNLLISPRQDDARQEDLPRYQREFENSFANNPSVDFKSSEIKEINGRDFIVIEMITPAVDTKVYNLMLVTSSEGKLLVVTFNCTVGKLKEWQPLAKQILNSVKVKE